MKLRTRFTTATLAGIFAFSAVGAAQPEETPTTDPTTADATSQTSETPPALEPTQSEALESEDPDPPDQEETDDTQTPEPPAPPVAQICEELSFEYDETSSAVVVTWPHDLEYTGVDVTIDDEPVEPQSEADGEMHLELDPAAENIRISFTDDDGEELPDCTEEIPDPSPSEDETDQEPTEDPEDATEDPPGDGQDTPSSEDPEPAPPTTPTPTTPAPAPGSPTPTPSSPAPAPTTQAPGAGAPAPEQDIEHQAPPPPAAPSSQQPSNESEAPVERNIRQHSESPRHLLSQLWEGQSHAGATLIRPEPRDLSNGPNTFETLPPVSDDELDDIKSRVATPDKGNGLTTDDLISADANDRLASSSSAWLVSVVIGIVLVGFGIWWALTRRKPRH